MPELNVITAAMIGAFAAAIWSVISIRWLLRSSKISYFSRKQRSVVWVAAGMAFLPSLLIGFVCSVALSRLTVSPGPWNHLVLSLTVVFGLGIFGAAITWAAAKLVATVVQVRKAHT